jgi:4-amino-4-deoxy-L-arabinose transferase-like glycosyltransferase
MSGSLRIARLCRSPLAGVALVVVCLLAHWPGAMVLPPVDRDESRFAQATRQVAEAAEQGDWPRVIVPHVQDRPRINKPPLVYWLGIGPALALDDPASDLAGPDRLPTGNIFAFRLVSLVSAMVAVILTWRVGLALRFHPAAAWMGAAILAVCVMVSWDARQARADQTLLACTTGAMLCLAHLWRLRRHPVARTRGWVIGLAIWVSLGVLAKGIAIVIVGLAAFSLIRSRGGRTVLRHLRAPWVIIASLAPAIVWLIATRVILGDHTAGSTAVRETIWRALIPREGHWGPPGYHLVLLPILFFPGCLATAAALGRAFSRTWAAMTRTTARARIRALLVGPLGGDDRTVFCLAWIILPWVMFELSMTKLPHYTVPLYPAIALLSARALLRMRARTDCLGFWGSGVFLTIALALGVGVPVVVAISAHAPAAAIVGAGLPGVVLWALTAWSLRRNRPVAAQGWAMALSVVTMAILARVILPTHPDLWVSSRIARVLEAPEIGANTPIGAVGYHEDSLIFLTRGRAHRVGGKRLDAWLDEHNSPWAIVQRGSWDIPPERFRIVPAAEGVNYSNGRWVVIDLVRRMQNDAAGYDPVTPHPESGDAP